MQLWLGLNAVDRGHSHCPAVYRLHGARLSAAVRQVQYQAITRLDRRIAVQGHYPASSGRYPATVRAAGNQLVSHWNDIARQRNAALHPGFEGDSAILAVAEQRPLATALGFRGAGATNRGEFDWTIAVPPLKCQISHRDYVGIVVVGRVVVAHQRATVVGVPLGTAINELAGNDVRPSEDVVDVLSTRHVRLHIQRTVSPVHHAPVDRRQVAQQGPGLGTALQVQVAQETWLLAALAIGYQLVAILGNAVHLPLVDHPGLDALAQAETVLDAQAVSYERRVVGPGLLEGSVPNAGVGACYRVVVGGHRPALGLAVHGHRRDVLELLGIEFDVKQCSVRVPQLFVDDLGVTGNGHRVGDGAAVGVRSDPANAHHPARSGGRQIHPHRALVAVGCLAIHCATVSFGICPAIGGDVDRVLDAVTIGIAAAVLAGQAWPSHANTHGRELGIAQSAGEWVVAAQLDADRGLVLHGRNTLDIVLLDRTLAPLPFHAWEVDVATGIHDRRVVEVDVAVGRSPVELTLTHRNQELGQVRRLQAVRCLDWRFRFAVAAFGASDIQMSCCAHAFLRA
ncbi:hypothetical protein D3C77_339550 [compost metagenome]